MYIREFVKEGNFYLEKKGKKKFLWDKLIIVYEVFLMIWREYI